MPTFKIKAGSLDGKVFYREMEAASREGLAKELEKEGLYPLDIRQKGVSFPGLKSERSAKPQDLLTFNSGLLTLLKAGISIVDSLEALKKSTRNAHLLEAIGNTIKDVRNGSALSDAMRKNPKTFPVLFTASIAAGEVTGDLIPAIKGYIEYQKRVEAIRKKIVSSATYPLILAAASLAVLAFLIAYVVPSFTKIYADTRAELPLPTKVLINGIDALKTHFIVLIASLGALSFGVISFLKSEKGKAYLDKVKLSLPQLGKVYKGYSIAKFSRTAGMVLKSGLPLIRALEMSKGVLNNSALEADMDNIIRKAKEGGSVTDAISEAGFLPDISLIMFSAGEKSASLQTVLEEIADFHEEDVGHRIEIITDMIEPALMIIMGLVIGTIVVLMYLPIFNLGATI